MKMKRFLCLLLVAVMAFGLLAACKRPVEDPSTPTTPGPGSSTPVSEAPSGAEVVSQGVTDDTVTIGTISLVSGAFAFIGQPAYDGFRACIARLNAQGGVQGRQIEIIAYDDQFDAATGKAYMERFVEQDKVFLLASLFGNVVEPSLDYLKEKGIPIINISSGLDVCFSEYDPDSRLFQVQPANLTDARYLIARVLNESIFGPNKDQKLPETAKIAVVHGVDSASMSSLGHLQAYAQEQGALDRLVCEAVTQETYATAIQKFKNEGCEVCIYMGVDSTTWISAMDDARWEVPVIFSYGASTLQSFVPDTYKATRPCYATIWADYATAEGQAMLDDMVDALTYLPDVDDTLRTSYRDNNYCCAGYLYGMTLVNAFERLNAHEGEWGLNWVDFTKAMEEAPFELGCVTFDYMNGLRLGVYEMALVEYIGYPETGKEELIQLRPFETLEEVAAK